MGEINRSTNLLAQLRQMYEKRDLADVNYGVEKAEKGCVCWRGQ